MDPGTLEEFKKQLDVAETPNKGIENDEPLRARYMSFCHPDGTVCKLYDLAEQS